MTRAFLKYVIVILILFFPIQNSFGHGLGLDTIPSIEIGESEFSMTVELPMNFEKSVDKQITITTIDKETEQSPSNLTLLVGLFHNKDLIFEETFLAKDGILSINVKNGQNAVQISGERDSSLGAWYGTKENPLEITGPVFESGGLYNFEIQIYTINEITNPVEDPKKYYADVIMIDSTFFEGTNQDGEPVPFQIKSYFNTPTSFDYDSKNKMVKFEIPFDWSEKQISHIPVVHQEVHFPKNFEEFFTPGYGGKVNGIDLFKSSVTVDDYSIQQERIVHFVLLGDHLKFLKNEQQKTGELPENMVFTLTTSDVVDFPISAMTKNEQFQIDLSWAPLEIEPEKNTKFVFTIRDGTTGETLRQSSYNLVLIQNGKEIYRTNGEAAVGGAFEDFTFSKDQTGPTIIRFENIRGTGQQTEFGIVVVPEFGAISILILLVGLSSIFLIKKNFLIYSRY